MRLVAHLVRADVRRFRLLLAAWVLIEVTSTVFTGVQPGFAGDPRTMTTVGLLGTVLFLTRWLGMIVIVALVVQTHPLVGSDAFWMTRPIPPRELLVSKVLLLGTTFLLVPALCDVALTAVFHVPVAEMGLVALQTILFQSLWLAFVMALSAVTRNLPRFVLVAGGVLVSLALLMSIGIAMAMRSFTDGPQLGQVLSRSAPNPLPAVVVVLFLIAAAVAPVIVQYKTRLTRVSVGVGVASLAAAILVGVMWPWRTEPLPVPAWASQESALRLVAESATGEFTLRENWPGSNRTDGWQIGKARLRLRGIEPSWLATIRLADSTVQFDDGVTLRTAGNGYQEPAPFEAVDEFPNRVVTGQVLGVERVSRMSLGEWITRGVPAIVISQTDFKKYSAANGTYRGRFLLDLDRIEIAATLPLQAGAEYVEPRRRITIDRITPQMPGLSIRLRQWTVSTMFHAESVPQLSFYLRNRAAAAAVAGSPGGAGAISMGLSIPTLFGLGHAGPSSSGFNVASEYVQFSGYSAQEDGIEITADWLSHAELVIVRTVPAGSVTRTVEIPGFEIRPAPPAPAMLRFR